MGLRLEIISRHRQGLGERGRKEFGQNGGTIGRSLESDWVLPDGQRFLSSRHASIDFRSGSYYIIDTSTNGVYINDATEPVGRGKPQRLFTNDRVRIGDYEILVEIDDIENTRETLANGHHIDPVDVKQRVEAPDPTTYDLVDAYEITGVGIEMLLDEDQAETLNPASVSIELSAEGFTETITPAPAKPKRKSPRPAPAKMAAEAKPTKRAASPPKASGGSSAALDTLLRGAGLKPKQLSEQQAATALHTMGQLLREAIVGLTENLYLRAAQKNTLKQHNTTIQPRDNNPLKFSASVDEALENLLFRESDEYLPAVAAVRAAFNDVKWHQHSMLRALEPAVSRYVAHLDPDTLEEKLARGRSSALMNAANKLKYWDIYRDLYLVVTQHPEGELPVQFLDELASAYEREQSRMRPSERRPAQQTEIKSA